MSEGGGLLEGEGAGPQVSLLQLLQDVGAQLLLSNCTLSLGIKLQKNKQHYQM